MNEHPESTRNQTDIHTDGGTAFSGDVSVRGGHVIGRDQNIYVNNKETPLFVNVPALPAHFLGRDALIAELVTRLCAGETTALSNMVPSTPPWGTSSRPSTSTTRPCP